jgi:hypothetical protein
VLDRVEKKLGLRSSSGRLETASSGSGTGFICFYLGHTIHKDQG